MWPTAELHVHIEGTLEVELLVDLARRNRVELPITDLGELRELRRFTDLQSFLDLYYQGVAVLRTDQDFYDLTAAYLRRAAAGGVRRAEIFFDPQSHLQRGVPLEAVASGLSGAVADLGPELGISADFIGCFLRDLGAAAAMEALDAMVLQRGAFGDEGAGALIGVGLDSAEVGHPPAPFAEVYHKAAADGLHRVAHAGEEGGPEYVWEALDLLHVERVDHGNRALEDPELAARLRDDAIPLTVCPLSNQALHTGPQDLADHPLPAMLEEGLVASVHSDDPAYFGGYLDEAFSAVAEALRLGPGERAALARNSFRSSFAPASDVARWVAEVDATLEQETAAGERD